MASLYPYTFNGTSRLRNDNTDKSQQTVMNTKFNNYMLSTYFSDSLNSDHVTFATKQPAMMFTGSNGGASAGVKARQLMPQICGNTQVGAGREQ